MLADVMNWVQGLGVMQRFMFSLSTMLVITFIVKMGMVTLRQLLSVIIRWRTKS